MAYHPRVCDLSLFGRQIPVFLRGACPVIGAWLVAAVAVGPAAAYSVCDYLPSFNKLIKCVYKTYQSDPSNLIRVSRLDANSDKSLRILQWSNN